MQESPPNRWEAIASPGDGFALSRERIATFVVLLTLIALTVADQVLIVVLMDTYTEHYSQFINQATAAVYCTVSTSILAVRWLRGPSRAARSPRDGGLVGSALNDAESTIVEELLEGEDKDAVRRPAPWHVLVAIGLFNGLGNFFMAVSQPHTAGLTQSLLGLLNIPLVMLLSFLCLGRRPSLCALLGAALIVGGAFVSSAEPRATNTRWYFAALYAAAQTFLAGEKVFEEHTFTRRRADVMVMFCWTLWTQFSLGFLLYPAQTIPALGGLDLTGIPKVVWDGAQCAAGIPTAGSREAGVECGRRTALLFFGYCAVDFCCYAYGLKVIQEGGANVMVVASAVALPLIQLVLCSPLVPLIGGRQAERFDASDLVALVLVLAGFAVYQLLSKEGRSARLGRKREDGK
jgi:drug/metabolite transporter (DMT)-like permease